MIRFFFKASILLIALLWTGRWTIEWMISLKSFSDKDRIVSGLIDIQIDGLKTMAQELGPMNSEQRQNRLDQLAEETNKKFRILPAITFSPEIRKKLSMPDGFYPIYQQGLIDYLTVAIDSETYLQLGPSADLSTRIIEEDVGDWLRVLASQIEFHSNAPTKLSELKQKTRVPVQIWSLSDLPTELTAQFDQGKETAFFTIGSDYFVGLRLSDGERVLSAGPLTKFKKSFWADAAKTLLVWMIASVFLVGILVFQLFRRFRRIEIAAIEISKGKIDTRVDVAAAGEARELALAFNSMAAKTEEMILSKKELLEVVSHELRTPLARLRFAFQLLETTTDPNVKQMRQTEIQRSMDDIDAIVSEVIEYVRNEDYAPVKDRVWLGVQDALAPEIQNLTIDFPHLSIEWAFPDAPPQSHIFAHRIAFHRAIGNLVSNAIRYAKSTIVITVYRTTLIDGRTCACFEIQDDGQGIAPEHRESVLKPFVRIDEQEQANLVHTGRKHAGLGLGLTIVQRILQQHAGAIQIDTGRLGGCLVRTYWPLPYSTGPVAFNAASVSAAGR